MEMAVNNKKQADDGVYLLNEFIDYTQGCCDDYISKVDDNSLITSFNNRIDKLDFINDTQKKKLNN